jgi:hypothetical protein
MRGLTEGGECSHGGFDVVGWHVAEDTPDLMSAMGPNGL